MQTTEIKKATFELPVDVHVALKIASAKNQESMQALVIRAVKREFALLGESASSSQTAN